MHSTGARLVLAAITFVSLACEPPPGPIEVVEASIADIQEAIVSGRTTCRMVVQGYLDRIEAYDESTVNAITVVNPNALSQGRRSRRTASGGSRASAALLRAHAREGQL